MNKRTMKIGAVVCIGLVMTGAMFWVLMNKPKQTYEPEEKTFLVDVFHWGFVTASSSDPQMATNSLNDLGMPTTTLQVNARDKVTIVFRNAEVVPALKEKYRPYMDRALAAAGFTPAGWEQFKQRSPLYSGYLITLDCYCGIVELKEGQSTATLTFTASGAGTVEFRAINALEMVPMNGNIVVV